jgi:hypothetical protein
MNVNIVTPDGKAAFARRFLNFALTTARLLRSINSQGLITWDIEGEQYPDATYIGDPRVATQLAPELADNGLIDKYFSIFRRAGLRVGVTVRPQKLVFKDGIPHQVDTPDPREREETLAEKISYAREHWACSLFYIDSTGWENSPLIYRHLHERFPDVLLIPEISNPGMFSVCAPFGFSLPHAPSTPDFVREIYPGAFSVVNSEVQSTMDNEAETIAGVLKGDILLLSGNEPPNAALVRILRRAAGAAAPHQ